MAAAAASCSSNTNNNSTNNNPEAAASYFGASSGAFTAEPVVTNATTSVIQNVTVVKPLVGGRRNTNASQYQ